jgi:hypothetical protein
MMHGLKFSLAARAAASSAGRSSSLQRIRRRARSREVGDPGRILERSAAHGASAYDARWSGAAVMVVGGVTVRVLMHRIIQQQ